MKTMLQNLTKQRIRGTDIDEVLYASDTICFTQTVAAMNRLLKAIEEEGQTYGLKLNRGKCEYLSFGNAGDVKFANGETVTNKLEVKYLGCNLNSSGDSSREISQRIIEFLTILNRLHIFWRHGGALNQTQHIHF